MSRGPLKLRRRDRHDHHPDQRSYREAEGRRPVARSGAAAGRVVCQQLVCSQSPRRPQAPSPHTLATASVDLLHLGDVRLQGRRALVPVARALKRRRPVVLQRRQVRRPQVSQVSLVLLRAARISRLWPAARDARGLASAPALRDRQAGLAPLGRGQTSSSLRRHVVAVPKVAHAAHAIHTHAAHAHSTCVQKHSVRHVPPWPGQRAAVLVPPVIRFDACGGAPKSMPPMPPMPPMSSAGPKSPMYSLSSSSHHLLKSVLMNLL